MENIYRRTKVNVRTGERSPSVEAWAEVKIEIITSNIVLKLEYIENQFILIPARAKVSQKSDHQGRQ